MAGVTITAQTLQFEPGLEIVPLSEQPSSSIKRTNATRPAGPSLPLTC